PDNAFDLVFDANVQPSSGLASAPTAIVVGGTGNCNAEQGTIVPCNIYSLTAGSTASVEVDVTPSITAFNLQSISVAPSASANSGQLVAGTPQTVNITDFTVAATAVNYTVTAGDPALINVQFCPSNPTLGYSATITPAQTTSPSMVTATTPTFNPTTVTLSGSACGTTTLTIPTVARPVNNGSLVRRGSFYAAWLPIGGLTVVGLGIGAGRKRRRWLVGAVLGLIAGVILLQSACSSANTTVATAGGTSAGIYLVTITGSTGTGASHNQQ